jgi:hypothetical protein
MRFLKVFERRRERCRKMALLVSEVFEQRLSLIFSLKSTTINISFWLTYSRFSRPSTLGYRMGGNCHITIDLPKRGAGDLNSLQKWFNGEKRDFL